MGSKFEKFKSIIKKFSAKNEQVEFKQEEGLLSSRLAEDAKSLIEELFNKLGPRPAATKESRRAARHIAAIFEGYSEDVTITSSRIYTSVAKGLLVSILIVAPLAFLFTLFNMPIMTLALIALWCFSFYLQIKKKRNIFKILMPSDEAANVHAVLEPEELVEETIVFTSHHDSASENIIQSTFSFKYFSLYYIPAFGFLTLAITSITQLLFNIFKGDLIPGITSPALIVFSLIGCVLTYSSLFSLKTLGKKFVSGAGDNLSGVSVIIQLLRYFSSKKKVGLGLKHTRLVFASFDGEECGVQGSAAWFKNNRRILFNAKVINFDGLFKAEDLVFLTQDGNGLVPLSSSLASRCSEIALSMGYKIETGKLGIMAGETDASSAAKAGYKATSLTSMRPEAKTPAHTEDDTPDKVELEALSEAIVIGIKFAESEDEALLKVNQNEMPTFLEADRKYRLTK